MRVVDNETRDQIKSPNQQISIKFAPNIHFHFYCHFVAKFQPACWSAIRGAYRVEIAFDAGT
jgi:hypothetical protein